MGKYIAVLKEEREEFIKKVLTQETHFHIPERDTPFSKAIMKRWPGTIWCQIGREPKGVAGTIYPAYHLWVPKIKTKAGRVIAWRNGGDKGDYNFLVYVVDTKEFHPRPNVKDVVDLIEMIDAQEDVVLSVGQPLSKRNKAYLERTLKS
jgi:hypothetical protein